MTPTVPDDAKVAPRQTAIGLAVATVIMGGWAALHVYGVYFHRWGGAGVLWAIPLVVLQTWLSVGLFITAHDAMHGSLAPGRPRLNAAIGSVAVALYAGFRFSRLQRSHFAHHDAPGGPDDPDFHAAAPRAFLPWFLCFFRTYFGWTEFAILTAALAIAVFVLGARIENLLVFWALPALLSALQLFVFGTWLPHRQDDSGFVDHHHARSNGYPRWLSLITCYHFGGRHHEHHLSPWRPWWRL